MKDLHLLGKKVEDKVTGLQGVVTSLSYDLYGCIQAIITPHVDKEGKCSDPIWHDTKRLKVLDGTPVMPVPSFIDPAGGQVLPPQNRY